MEAIHGRTKGRVVVGHGMSAEFLVNIGLRGKCVQVTLYSLSL